jgi:hypothetical protein
MAVLLKAVHCSSKTSGSLLYKHFDSSSEVGPTGLEYQREDFLARYPDPSSLSLPALFYLHVALLY